MEDIYFAASIRGGIYDIDIYFEIINYLKKYGNVLTEHIGRTYLTSFGKEELSDGFIHFRDMGWITNSKNIVAEVTQSSLGVGYEIGRIVERNKWVSETQRKNILCLYKPRINKKLSAMIAGSDGVINANYKNLEEAFKAIDNFFKIQ